MVSDIAKSFISDRHNRSRISQKDNGRGIGRRPETPDFPTGLPRFFCRDHCGRWPLKQTLIKSKKAKRIRPAGSKLEPQTLVEKLTSITIRAQCYFDNAANAIRIDQPSYGAELWRALPESLRKESEDIIVDLTDLFKSIGQAIKQSPFLKELDAIEAGRAFKGMSAALQFKRFEHRESRVVENEDRIVAVVPEQESTDLKIQPAEAWEVFEECADSIESLLRLTENLARPAKRPETSEEPKARKTPQENVSQRRALVKSAEEVNPRMKGKGLDGLTCKNLDRASIEIPEEWRSKTIMTWEQAYNDPKLKPLIQKMFSSDRTKS
jgi:hypothetical protein